MSLFRRYYNPPAATITESLFSGMVSSAIQFSKTYRMAVNVASAMLCVLAADMAVQLLYDRRKARQGNPGIDWCYNYLRSARLVVVAGLIGIISHKWYSTLDEIYVTSGAKDVTAKLVLDEVVMAPFVVTSYIFAVGLLEGNKVNSVYEEWKQKFTKIYQTDVAVWPGIQLINFVLVPAPFRVLYINICTFLWNIYLIHAKHSVQRSFIQVRTVDILGLSDRDPRRAHRSSTHDKNSNRPVTLPSNHVQ